MGRFGSKAFFAILCGVCLLTVSCSRRVNFVLINGSDHRIQVLYKANLRSFAVPGDRISIPQNLMPARVSLEKWKAGAREGDWKTDPTIVERFDFDSGEFLVQLGPKEAVKILWESDVIYNVDNGQELFALKSIQFRDGDKSVSYFGPDLLDQFSENSYSERFLLYK